MATKLDRRLAELERQIPERALRVIWVNPGETRESALARAGATYSERLLFVGWQQPEPANGRTAP